MNMSTEGGLVVVLILVGVAVSIATTVIWVLCLIHAAKTERWGWFVAMLLFGFVALFYFFVEYESAAQLRARQEREQRERDELDALRDQEVSALREEVARLRSER